MPGLVGVVSGERRAGASLELLLAPMCRGTRVKREALAAPSGEWALGRVHLGALQPAPQLAADERVQVLLHGSLDNERELRALVGLESGSASELLRALYRREGGRASRRLEGVFCAAILDEDGRRLLLVGDALASYPLYWCTGPFGFAFAGELRALLRLPALPRRLDLRTAADYLWFGFPFGERTLAESVSLLGAGATLCYDLETSAVSIETGEPLSRLFAQTSATDRAIYAADTAAAFGEAVARAVGGPAPVGLSLSGGLDSRAILSAAEGTGVPLRSYTLGVAGCADQVIARKLASIAGTEHRFFELDDGYLTDFLPNLSRLVSLTDGMYLSHGLTEMLALRFLEQDPPALLVRGHGGELAKASLAWPFHTDARVHAMRSLQEFVPYFLQRVNYLTRGVPLHDLFADAHAGVAERGPRLSLEESLQDRGMSPANACSYLYLSQQHRRFTVASLELFRNEAELRMPFVDERFLKVLLAGHPRWRDDTDLHRLILRRFDVRLLAVRDSNTGAPAGAGGLQRALLDKLNQALKRLNVYGYRHYHSFDAWMRERLLESVEAIVLSPQSLERGVFRAETLKRLFRETRDGGADHAYLFQVLLILELWQREHGF